MYDYEKGAVKDQGDLSCISDLPPVIDQTTLQPSCILPNTNNYKELHINVAVVMARVVVKYISFFSMFGESIPSHITHDFSAEMSHKSEIVYIHIQYFAVIFVHRML